MTEDVPEKFRRGFRSKDAFADQAAMMPDARVILDVGANAGQTSARYRSLFPDARIHAFEPFPAVFNQLAARFRNDPLTACHRKALAETSGPQTLFTNTMNVTNALTPFRADAAAHLPPGVTPAQAIPIEAMALDDFCETEDIERIDILKMDAQGSEPRILKGAARMLRERRIGLVYTEVMFVPVYEGQGKFYEVAALLGAAGYDLYDFYSFTYAGNGQVKWGDAVFTIQSHEHR
jgi:FkbM family methyltransferase